MLKHFCAHFRCMEDRAQQRHRTLNS